MDIKSHIPVVADWPRPGVDFLDITGLLEHAPAFNHVVNQLSVWTKTQRPSSIVAVESRGFIFGAPIAKSLGLPLILVRKPHKLPGSVHTIPYLTEYSQDSLAIKNDSKIGSRPCVIDDVIATGGTIGAVADLLSQHWSVEMISVAAVIALDFLPGMSALEIKGIRAHALIHYA